jgi:tetratricopeptide (TPR) repeat protein
MRTLSHSLRLFCCALFPFLAVAMTGCNLMSSRQANLTGKLYYAAGNYTAAAHAFNRASIDDPRNADAAYNLASARRKQGRIADAEQGYRQALQINPDHQPSYHALATVMKDQNRHAEAQNLLQSWVAIKPGKAAPYVELAWLQREMGDSAGAEQSLTRAINVQPNHPTALAHLGQLYHDSGQSGRAVAMYQRSLHSRWYQPEVHSRLASLKNLRGPRQSSGTKLASRNLVPHPSYLDPRFAQGQPGIPNPSTTHPTPVKPRGPVANNADPAHVR